MNRVWRMDKTGSPGSNYIAIPNTTVFSAGRPVVVISSDTSFDIADSVIPLIDNGTYYYAQINPNDADHFTFASTNPNLAATEKCGNLGSKQ